MNKKHLVLVALLAGLASFIKAAPMGTAFTYQGRLTDGSAPVSGNYDLRFAIYDSAGGANVVGGPITNTAVNVVSGLFTATLDFSRNAFNGAAVWLEISARTNGVGAFVLLSPRQQFTPSPYAIFSAGSGSISNGVIQNPTFIGTTGNTPLDFLANNQRALRLVATLNSVNVIEGVGGNNVAVGVEGATIGGGGISGGVNRVAADFGTIGGGYANLSSNNQATVSGGGYNVAGGVSSTVGGGFQNRALQNDATVAGGYTNTAAGFRSTVGGGAFNAANNQYAVVDGGNRNLSAGDASAVGGGYDNTATGSYSTVSGGNRNAAREMWANRGWRG